MKKGFGALVLFGVVLLVATMALAQTRTITGETTTKTATIEAINKGTRELTVKLPDGKHVTFTASPEVHRFDALKVGDTITTTIPEIDSKVPSITFKEPNNWTYSSHVENQKALEKVKVGDKVDITWTQAVPIGVEAAAKK